MYTEKTSRSLLLYVMRFPANQWLSCVISAIRTLGRMCNRDKGWCHGVMDKMEVLREGDGERFDVVYCPIRYATLNYNQIIVKLHGEVDALVYEDKIWACVSVCVRISVRGVISVEWGFGKVRKHDGVHSSNDLNWSRWGSLSHSEWRCLLHWTSVQHEWKNELMPSNTTDFIYWR